MCNSPRNANGVINAIVLEYVEELRRGADGAHEREAGEEGVPHGEHVLQVVLGPRLHEVLPAENQDHVEAAEVEADGPVLGHPGAGVLVLEFLLEVEEIGVVPKGDIVVVLHGDHRLKGRGGGLGAALPLLG